MKRLIHLLKQVDLMISAFKPALRLYVYVALGIAIGMLVAGILTPTKFKNDAVPAQMDDGFRDQWIKDAANGYQYISSQASLITTDAQSASSLQNVAREEAKTKLIDAGATVEDIDRLISANANVPYLVSSLQAIRPIAQEANSQAQEQREEYGDPSTLGAFFTSIFVYILVALAGVLIVVYVKLFGIPFLKPVKRLLGLEKIDPRMQAERKKREEAQKFSKQKTVFDTPPVAQFMSTYLSGDNYYDDSFAIELDDDMNTFLGECGSGIAESIGTGDPKKVTATEVWIFDKNDISTLTHVLMSEYAYHNEEIRAKLAPRGEAILVREGDTTILESQTLNAQIKVVSLEYGEADGVPPNSFFERLTVEIAVWQKEGAASGGDDRGFPDLPPPIMQAPAQPLMPPQGQPMPPQAPPLQPPPMPPQGPPPGQPFPPQQRPPQGPPPQGQPFPPQQRPPQGPPPGQPFPPQQRPPQGPPPQGQPFPPQQRPPQGPPPGQPFPPQQRPPQGPPPPQGGQRPPSPFGDTGELDV